MTTGHTKPLSEEYLGWLEHTIDEEGVTIPHGLILDDDDNLTVVALALTVEQGYRFMVAKFQELGAKEAIFAFDRYTKPGQGTTLGDVMADHHLFRGGTRPFIVEYQHAPRIVKPVCWDNPFWNAALNLELLGTLRAHMGISE